MWRTNLGRQRRSPFESEGNAILELLRRMEVKNTHKTDNTEKMHPCQKYQGNEVLIKKDGYGIEKKIKKFKSMIIDKLGNAKDLMVYKSKLYPMIFIKYTERLMHPKTKHLREIFKDCPKIRQKRDLIDSIFQRLFLKVERGYFNLSSFALEKANDIKVKMQKGDIFNLEQGKEVMFYFVKDEDNKSVNFTLFDKSMRSIQFDSEYIQSKRTKHPQDYKLYQKFIKNVFQEQKQFEMNDIFDNQEMESDQEVLEQEKMSFYEVKAKLNQILQKDLSQIQSKIQSLDEQIDAAGEKHETIKVLTEKKDDIESNLQNFKQMKESIQRLIRRQISPNVYHKCLKKMIIAQKQLQSQLPIVAKKGTIFKLLQKQNLIILQGQTGSGKSTQLPQMLCQYYRLFDDSSSKPVLVTQPRRLATRSLAERVASQMGERVGKFVDYVASAGKEPSQQAKIIFKLDRLVLDEITEDPLLTNYSCLVIDEAHERTISIDVILGLVKELLKQRKDFKVIITSASMDIPLFQRYFETKALKVNGQMYPIKITYKDYQNFREGDKNQMVHKIRKAIDEEILHDASSMKQDFRGHLLCFCSSVEEINHLVKHYGEKLNCNVFSVFALHGKISPKDQKRVFEDAGKHKIIFASRIAQTAITIDGVRVVIDPGQDIQLIYDQKYKVSSMKLKDISQSSAKQRAGRSGRTGPGHCFRLYSEQSFRKRKLNKAPQIQNSSLQTAVLRLKTINIKDVVNFPFISKPDQQCLKSSLDLLQLIGALKGKQHNYEPTQIGKLLVKMPIQPFLGRAIIESMIFQKVFETQKKKLKIEKAEIDLINQLGIVGTTIEILSLLLNYSGLFLIDKSEKQKGQKAKYTEFSDEDGDFFFLMNIFNKYKRLKQAEAKSKKVTSKFYKSSSELSKWIQNNYLNTRALVQAEKLAQQISFVSQKFFIHQINLADQINRVKQKMYNCKSFKEIILSSLITSFCSNLCKFSGNALIGYTLVTQKRPLKVYGSSNLQLLGINSDWIIGFDLYTNQVGRLFCKVAHQVSYDFLKNHVHKYFWNKYQIQSIQENNPFYEELSYDLPTKILQQIRSDFQAVENNQKLYFLKDMFPLFSQNKNRIIFFLIIDQKSKENTLIQKRQLLNKYIKQQKEKTLLKYEHNYVGSIYVNIQNGFEIKDIEFKHHELCVQVTTVTILVDYIIKICSDYGKFTIFELTSGQVQRYKKNNPNVAYEFQKLRFVPHSQQYKQLFLEFIQDTIDSFKQIPIETRIVPINQGNKMAQSKVYLYFYAGKCIDNNTIFMRYDNRNEYTIAFRMLDMLKEAGTKKYRRAISNGLEDKYRFITEKMKPNKRKNGINFFDHNFDQIQLWGELHKMVKDGILGKDFVYPRTITKFRDPVISQAQKTDHQWRQEIFNLLERIDLKRQNLVVNITGYNHSKKGFYGQVYGKNLRVIMTAQIFSVDNTNLDQIKPTLQGKKILGCDKMHVKNYYDHTIALVGKKVFEALEEKYYILVQKYKASYPLMNLITISKKVRNQQRILIMSRSQDKMDSAKIQQQVLRLFTPKILKLDPFQFKFLDKLEIGQIIMDDIEHQYNYKIYFSFQRFNKCMKLYCQQHQTRPIEALLKARIKTAKFSTQVISYHGKNLNVVRSILDKHTQNQWKQVVMTYEIKFQTRQILITTDLDTFSRIKLQIARIAQTSKGQCQICADFMQNPYQFLNCSCSFCWQCVTNHIKSFRNSMEKVLLCPSQNCKKPINVNDIKTILSQQEFQDLCELKIKQYLDINRQKYYSCNVCQHIINMRQVEETGIINCQVCGRNQCIKCKQSHPGYNCAAWKQLNNLTSKFTQFGIKVCKKCGQGIQKNGGCNHMKCTRCKSHICWKCEEVFATQEQCYDHLAKVCGGIFDRNVRE